MVTIRAFIARFRGSEFAKNTAVLTLGTVVAQGVAIASMPVLSRLYTPADFGLLAVFLAVSSIVATAITLRYETAILLPKDEHESKTLVLLSAVLAVLIGILIGLIAWLLPEAVKSAMGISVLNEWLVLAVLCGTTTALATTGSNWYNRHRAYIKMTTLRITQSGIGALIGIALGLWGFSAGLMLAQIFASLTVAIIVIFSLRSLRENWRNNDFCTIASKHKAAPKYLLPTALLDVVTLQLPVLLITAWFSSEVAGQFSMAWKMLAIPAALVGGALGQVFLQRFAQIWPNAQLARQLLFRTWKILAIVGVLPTILVMMFGEQLFTWVLGSTWASAGEIAVVIAPMLFAMLVSSPTSGIFMVLGLQKYSLFFGISFVVYRTACIYFGVINNNILYGLLAWVLLELLAITIYNLIALKRMEA